MQLSPTRQERLERRTSRVTCHSEGRKGTAEEAVKYCQRGDWNGRNFGLNAQFVTASTRSRDEGNRSDLEECADLIKEIRAFVHKHGRCPIQPRKNNIACCQIAPAPALAVTLSVWQIDLHRRRLERPHFGHR